MPSYLQNTDGGRYTYGYFTCFEVVSMRGNFAVHESKDQLGCVFTEDKGQQEAVSACVNTKTHWE